MRSAALLLALLLPGAALAAGCGDTVSLGPGSDVGGGGGTGGVGAGPGCSSDDQCIVKGAACLVGTCQAGACLIEPVPDGLPCEDGLKCTAFDACSGGICQGAGTACPDPGACLEAKCSEVDGECFYVPRNEGQLCEDFDACSLTSICSMGSCFGIDFLDCSFLEGPCSFGVCGINGCEALPVNDGFPCEDGLFCTIGETCKLGACTDAFGLMCPPPSGSCLQSFCDEGTQGCYETPVVDGTPCNDQSVCTVGSACYSGLCSGGMPANEGTSCDDANGCTAGDVCSLGSCIGTPLGTLHLGDDFASAAGGWQLDQEWGIGPAIASTGGVYGADPDLDHTSTADDGVAGVVIGGNADISALHGPRYLTSPPFDASGPGKVVLAYWRWLNSDYDPYMHNYVEVFNGNAWLVVWQSGGPPGVQDSPPVGIGWTPVTHDLTPFKNAAMQVRFGFDITSAGVFTIGSWNLDDVSVLGCP